MGTELGLVPWLLGGGGVTALVLLLRWGRQDSRDVVEMSNLNAATAGGQRDAAMKEAEELRDELRETRRELDESRREGARLRRLLERHQIDPETEPA